MMSRIPGPRPLPVIGSLHKMKKPPCLTFSKLAQTHGDVFLIKLGSTDNVILNSEEALRQAFEEQGEAFSFRDQDFLSLKIYMEVRGEENVGLTCRSACTDVWRMQHEVIRLAINDFVLGTERSRFERSTHAEVTKLVTSWLGKDNESSRLLDPIASLERLAGRLKAAYIIGENVSGGIEDFDQRFESYNDASVRMLALMRGGFIDDFLPCLGFLARSKHDQLRDILSVGGRFFEDVYKVHQVCYQSGSKETLMDCVASLHEELERKEQGRPKIPRKTIMGVIPELLEGVANSRAVTLQIMMYTIHYPDVQIKVRQEIREVVGLSRYPSLEDRKSLPYTEAVIYEVCRHSSVLNVTVPHTAGSDVILGGRYNMLIPKGATVIGNLLAIHRNPDVWTNPEEFNPDRFINEDGHLDEEKVQKCMIFSIGKRSCIAEMMSRREMFLLFSTLIHLCKFENEGTPLVMQEIGGLDVPRDGCMKVRITRTDVNITA